MRGATHTSHIADDNCHAHGSANDHVDTRSDFITDCLPFARAILNSHAGGMESVSCTPCQASGKYWPWPAD
jgi:hypothetical protein